MNNKKLLVKNSLSGIIQLLITAVFTFLCVPVLISKLGLELYGVFAVLSVVSNLSTLADLGMDRALIVYLSNQGKSSESNYDIFVALFIKSLLLIFLLTFLVGFEKKILLNLLNIPIQYYNVSVAFYRCILISNVFMILGMSFASILDALQKVYLNSFSRFIYSIIYWLGILFVTLSDYGLFQIGLISILASSIWFIITVFWAFNYWGAFSIHGISGNMKRVFYKQILYSSKIFFASILNLFFEPLSKILISNFIGLNAVALFDVALRIRGQIASLFSKAIYPLGPYIANSTNSSYLYGLIIDITKKIHLIVIPFSVIIIFVTQILLYLWIGDSTLEELTLFVSVLCGSFLLFVPPTYPIYQYLYTKSLAGKTVWIQFVNVFVNVLVFLSIYPFCGLYTILYSNAIAYFCSFLLSIYYMKKFILIDHQAIFVFYAKIGLLFLILFTIGLFLKFIIPFSILDLVFYPVFIGTLYLSLIKFLRLIVKKDIDTYLEMFPRLRITLNHFFKK